MTTGSPTATPGGSAPAAPTTRLILAGVLGGFLAGLFGVGGGIVMVPLFVLWLGLDQRRAVTTSLVAIIPISVLGIVGYATGGSVEWAVGLAIGVGSIAGAQLGTWLLPRIPIPALQVAFAVILIYSAFRLVFPPDYGPPISTADQPWALLLIMGVVAGVVAALLGVGGGIIVVPALVLLVGASLTDARGTSLLVVLITAIAASVTNVSKGRADTRVGIIVGLAGAPAALLAAFVAHWMPEQQAAILFALLMLVAAIQLLRRAYSSWRSSRRTPHSPATRSPS